MKSLYCPYCGTEAPGFDLRVAIENPIGVIDRDPACTVAVVARCCRSILSVALANAAAPGAR